MNLKPYQKAEDEAIAQGATHKLHMQDFTYYLRGRAGVAGEWVEIGQVDVSPDVQRIFLDTSKSGTPWYRCKPVWLGSQKKLNVE